MQRNLFVALLICISVSCIKHSDGDYEGVLIPLFEHFHIKQCIIYKELKLSEESTRMYVKSFSKIGVATAVRSALDIAKMPDGSEGTYPNTAVVLYVESRPWIQVLKASFPPGELLIKDTSIIYIVLVAPGLGSFTEYIYVPLYCQLLIVRPVIGSSIFIINEFYNIYELRKESEWGFWSGDTKLSVTVEESLFRRRRDFEGTILIAMYKEVNGLQIGLQYGFWNILQEFYNFTTWYQTYEELRRTGLQNDCFMQRAGMEQKNYMRDAVWPLGKSSYYIFMRRPTEDTSFWTSYLRPFPAKAWIVVLLFVLLIWVTIPVLKIIVLKMAVQTTKEKFDPVGYGCLPFDTLMNQNGIDVSRSTLSFRIGFFVTICFAALLQCLYGGELISYLTTHEYTLPFTDVTGFVKDGTYNVTFPKGKGKYTSVLLLTWLGPVVGNYVSTHYTEFQGYEQVPNQLCNDRVVFAAEKRIMESFAYWPDDCEIVTIPRPLDTADAALLLAPSSDYTSAFQFVLPIFQESGLYRHAQLEYYKKLRNDQERGGLTDVDLPRIVPALTLLFFGIALSLFVLLLELLFFRCLPLVKKFRKESEMQVVAHRKLVSTFCSTLQQTSRIGKKLTNEED